MLEILEHLHKKFSYKLKAYLLCTTVSKIYNYKKTLFLKPFTSWRRLLFDTFEISCIENFMENGAFALLEQMLHFLYYFQKYSKT